jgi:uncharacterized protein (DUF1778 family)
MAAPRSPGRPPKPPDERHSAKIEVLLLEEDKEMLQDAAARARTSVAALLREGGLERARQILAPRTRRKR